jgi:ankyrin repeat protein
MEWFQQAIETGAFEEQAQPATDDPESDNSEGMSNPSSLGLQSSSGANTGAPELYFPSETGPTGPSPSAAIFQSSKETHRAKPFRGRLVDLPKPNKLPVRRQRSRPLSAVAFVLRYDRSFYDACLDGDYPSAEKLLGQGANINAMPGQGHTALGRATDDMKLKMVAWLLSKGADPNTHGKDCYTPLLIAASRGYTEIARQLLAHGAKVSPYELDGETSLTLHKALKAGDDETAQLLIESGVLKTVDKVLRGLLVLAAVEGSCQKSFNMLLKSGDLDLEAKDSQGLTALDNAVQKDDLSMARSLMSRGAFNNTPSLDQRLRNPLDTFPFPKTGLVGRTVAKSAVEGYRRMAMGDSANVPNN